MKKLVFLFALCSILHGQDDYQNWLRKENDKLQSFLSEQDSKYYDFLKKEWKEFKINGGITRDKEPEPINIPIIKSETETHKGQPDTKKSFEEIINIPSGKSEPSNRSIENKEEKNPALNKVQHPEVVQRTDYNHLDFTYYEEEINVSYPKDLNIQLPGEITNQVIAEYWKKINSMGLDEFLTIVQSKQKEMRLNDWGYLNYVWQLSNKINSNKRNESLLLTWYVFLRSGYRVKIGLIDKNVMLFVKSNESIFDVPYIKENNGEKTYIINFLQSKDVYGSLYTYDDDYPGANKYLSMKINTSPIFRKDPVARKLEFSFDHKNYVCNTVVNKNLIDYYKDYPSTQYDTYFNAEVSDDIRTTLIPGLKEITKEMNELDAVNFLLRFTQTAFAYKNDKDNFGREKSLFVEETIFYPYSNCKDRAILFAYLVKNVLKLKIVGVEYPGHMATAVALGKETDGSFIMHNGIKYAICDPTYINADAGMSMPAHPVPSIEKIIDINE